MNVSVFNLGFWMSFQFHNFLQQKLTLHLFATYFSSFVNLKCWWTRTICFHSEVTEMTAIWTTKQNCRASQQWQIALEGLKNFSFAHTEANEFCWCFPFLQIPRRETGNTTIPLEFFSWFDSSLVIYTSWIRDPGQKTTFVAAVPETNGPCVGILSMKKKTNF